MFRGVPILEQPGIEDVVVIRTPSEFEYRKKIQKWGNLDEIDLFRLRRSAEFGTVFRLPRTNDWCK
jgi:hypothetical protein